MVKFISEVSSNHDRNIERSFDFITASAKAGCDAVKFQKRTIEKVYSKKVKGKNLLAISSGANVNFQRLNFIVERSELGENREKILNEYNLETISFLWKRIFTTLSKK